MIYEFITPSDAITFVANDDKVAYMATVLLSNGKAGCHDETGKNLDTLLLFVRDPTEIIEKELGEPMETFIESHRQELADCFMSFAYGSFEDRKRYDDCIAAITDVDKLKEFKNTHEDRNRTSMSQWVAYAWETGESMLEKLKQEKK